MAVRLDLDGPFQAKAFQGSLQSSCLSRGSPVCSRAAQAPSMG